MTARPPIHGLVAEFAAPEQILAAARAARIAGYRRMDAYTPYPVQGLATELGMHGTSVPIVVLGAAIAGAAVGFMMQYWSMAIDYPVNSGGRPENSWPVFVPITFEVMVLVASFAALFAMLILNGLPKLYRPLFHVPRFALATQDRFFLCIEAVDPRFGREETARFLGTLNPAEVVEVPH
jgi:hypothetical protein